MLAASCPFSPPRKKSIFLVEPFAAFFRYFAAPSKLSISDNSINMILQPLHFTPCNAILYFTLTLHIVLFHQALALLAGCSCHSPTPPRRWLWGPNFRWTWNPLGHKQSSYSLRFFWSFTLPHRIWKLLEISHDVDAWCPSSPASTASTGSCEVHLDDLVSAGGSLSPDDPKNRPSL